MIRICHKEASETGADSSGVHKQASERLNLNNTVQAKRSAVTDKRRSISVSERRDLAYVPIADNHIIEREWPLMSVNRHKCQTNATNYLF